MWNHFQTRGNVFIDNGQVVRGLTRTQPAFSLRFKSYSTAKWMSQLPRMSSKFQRGSVVYINHSETSPRCCHLCFDDAQLHPRVEIDQCTVPLCCLSYVVDIVQIGLSLHADLLSRHSLAQPNRSWISTQNGEKRSFGDINTRTGMYVNCTLTINKLTHQ